MKSTIKRIISITAVAALLTGVMVSSGFAFNANDLNTRTLINKNCTAPCDLTNANLSGKDLTSANLSGANMTGATLTDANLTSATMGGTNLTRAVMGGAKFNSAKLVSANLTSATISATTSFSNTNVSNAIWIDGTRFANPKSCANPSLGGCK